MGTIRWIRSGCGGYGVTERDMRTHVWHWRSGLPVNPRPPIPFLVFFGFLGGLFTLFGYFLGADVLDCLAVVRQVLEWVPKYKKQMKEDLNVDVISEFKEQL